MAKRNQNTEPALQPLTPVRPSAGVLLLFSLGQFGWSLGSFAVSNLLVYFYLPPERGESVFPVYIFQGAVLGLFTLVGFAGAAGRLFDGIIDPLIAGWSDRKKSPGGKRRWFLKRSAVPFALFGALAFFPPSESETAGNFLWLLATMTTYYFFFAMYVIPYNALMAELSHTPQERLKVSTWLSVAWALGFVAGNSAFVMQGWFEEQGMTPAHSFRKGVFILQALAGLCMVLPAFFLNENRYARQTEGTYRVREALAMVWRNGSFRWFLWAFLLYWMSLSFIQLGIGYYTTLLFGLDARVAFTFSLVSFISSFALYWPMLVLIRKIGKKSTLQLAYALLALLFLMAGFARQIPVDKMLLVYALAILASGPLAVFGILPNAIVGDAAETGSQGAASPVTGMYFAMTAFTMKVGISAANLLFPSLLLLGKSQDNPAGVQATAIAATLICLAGWRAIRNFEYK